MRGFIKAVMLAQLFEAYKHVKSKLQWKLKEKQKSYNSPLSVFFPHRRCTTKHSFEPL